MCFDCAGVCGLHVSPSHGAPRATPKSKKKYDIFQNLSFLIKKCKNIRKRGPKRCPKGWPDFGGGGLGGALDAPICFWTQKVCPKCSKNDLQGAKVTPKCFKSDPQGRKMHSYRSAKVVQVHQKMSAARYQARRTARSAFNKCAETKNTDPMGWPPKAAPLCSLFLHIYLFIWWISMDIPYIFLI